MFVIKNIDDLWNHIAYVLSYAPDEFPYRDFVNSDEQMNLNRAFEHLRQGVKLVYPEDSFTEKKKDLFDILDRSYEFYGSGKYLEAEKLINEFQDKIFKST